MLSIRRSDPSRRSPDPIPEANPNPSPGTSLRPNPSPNPNRRSNSTPRSSEADLAASAPTAEVSLSELSVSEVSISEKAAAPAIKHQVSLVGTRGYALTLP